MHNNSPTQINQLNNKPNLIAQKENDLINKNFEKKLNIKLEKILFKELGILEEKITDSPYNNAINLENHNKNIINNINRKKENELLIKQLQEELLSNLESKIKNIEKSLEKEYFKNIEQEKKIIFSTVFMNANTKKKIYNKKYGETICFLNTQLRNLSYKTDYYKEFIRDCATKITNLFSLLKDFKNKLFGPGSAYNEKVNIETLIKNIEEKITTIHNNSNILEKDLEKLQYYIDLFYKA